ncbi:MAG: hypothetical protein IT162_07500 [Bryobacterales bacterium]|nr:hypothetical protein [Bryobacterales bacterium]
MSTSIQRAALAGVLAATALCAQATRDFLTADEVDQIRLTAQDPNARLTLYAGFAQLRVDMLKQSVAKEKAGRSGFIHQTLEDYTKIIEAIDSVTDDALKRGVPVDLGLKTVADAERAMLGDLKAIEESEPSDLERYKFALTNAIETTEDSIELADEDLAERKKDVLHKDAQDRKKLQEMMTPEEVKERKQAEQKRAETETKQQRKAPTLRRKGEVPKPPQ